MVNSHDTRGPMGRERTERLLETLLRCRDGTAKIVALTESHAMLVVRVSFAHACFDADSRAKQVNELYGRYRAIWDSRPKDLKSIEEIEAWGREAFTKIP